MVSHRKETKLLEEDFRFGHPVSKQICEDCGATVMRKKKSSKFFRCFDCKKKKRNAKYQKKSQL